ncbi:LacI family transcriptional regulator [Rhodococcus sp. RS1C4]|nr:LacI family transcriptional regulator [Rhodococcus sp. RS1C4]OZC62087.1 LacI family transcriptional regulator [Rhodococcus sp. 06-621-2]OZD19470.1 LacI family transcriptional regulator [Rhodococcus sp. 06-156-3C]OZD21802.1 LacI family transcriptional regulator [Rhodococcus sp. 06-156-4C]OZD25489.1 LacI family transcriptional regulator [Rhodococcus sp. 06-156-4a]OZD32898.1 LacI family transcriptional regulator [Rhodococcus sp. 06-156-3b]OZD42029.1 LacI family transcriptional regulator [Rhod
MVVTHRYKVSEIAQQAGLSRATVDRVLHERPGVRSATRAEVQQAISDLDKQRSQLRLNGRKFLFDVVMQTPARFSAEFRAALEAELPMLSPAVVRCRFHFRETESVTEMVDTLGRFTARGSHGVIVKAPDDPEVVEAVDRLVALGIPVVTYVTDVPSSARLGYVGIDNRAAGSTAAYLVDSWLGDAQSSVLILLTSNIFRNEGEREIGFRSTLRALDSGRRVVEISDSEGLDSTVEERVSDALAEYPDIEAVYSIGGGNTGAVRAFERAGRRCRVFVAHDLDGDNRPLLRSGALSAVLHHDLRADARTACRLLMQAAGAVDGVAAEPSPIQIVTRFNTPAVR